MIAECVSAEDGRGWNGKDKAEEEGNQAQAQRQLRSKQGL